MSKIKFLFYLFSGEFHLGYNKNNIQGLSWYDFVHWDNLREAQSKHRLSKLFNKQTLKINELND